MAVKFGDLRVRKLSEVKLSFPSIMTLQVEPDSFSFLTAITKLRVIRHSTFDIQRSAKYPCRTLSKFVVLFSFEKAKPKIEYSLFSRKILDNWYAPKENFVEVSR